MSYNPNTWSSGNVVTEEKLNNIEEGIKELNKLKIIGYLVNDYNTRVLDHTWKEIDDAIKSGTIVMAVGKKDGIECTLIHCTKKSSNSSQKSAAASGGTYACIANDTVFVTYTETGLPVYYRGGNDTVIS